MPPIRPTPKAPKCLLRGATVLTADGERRVEDLAVGDLLPTKFGGHCPIEWIGRYRIQRSNSSTPWPREALPVRIARSALALNVPRTDLYVSQAHCLLIDGALFSAGSLINDATITLDEVAELDELEFFHIKLSSHDVIYAQGAPVETLLEVDESAANFAEYFRAYGMPSDEQVPCAPIYSHLRRGSNSKARMLRAISWVDRRRRIRAVRDRLVKVEIRLSREAGLSV